MSSKPIHGDAVNIMGLPLGINPHPEVLRAMAEVISKRDHGHYISITNTESMYHGLRIESHGAHIRNADFSLCDGVGVVVAGLAWGHRIVRYNGPILQLDSSEYGQQISGGTSSMAASLAWRRKWPNDCNRLTRD